MIHLQKIFTKMTFTPKAISLPILLDETPIIRWSNMSVESLTSNSNNRSPGTTFLVYNTYPSYLKGRGSDWTADHVNLQVKRLSTQTGLGNYSLFGIP